MDELIAEQAEAARVHASAAQIPLAQAELEMLGCNYAQVGGALARRWSMPASLAAAIEYHVDPRQSTPPAFVESTVHIAYWLTRSVIDDVSTERWAEPIVPESWETTGLTPACYSSVKVQVDAQYGDTVTMLSNGASRVA
jgi:hypothetical protein